MLLPGTRCPLNSWDFCWGHNCKSWQFWGFLCWWCGFASQLRSNRANRVLVWCCLKYETTWNHVSVHSNNVVSINQTKTWVKTGIVMRDGEASQMCLLELGISLLVVFIHWYLLRRQTWRSCYIWASAQLNCDQWQRRNSWPLSTMRGRGGLPPTCGSSAELRQILMHDDGDCMRTRKEAEFNLMGWSFAHNSEEYVKGCLHSWTHPLPHLRKKLRHLAGIRRTNLGFWRQEATAGIGANLIADSQWVSEGKSTTLCYKKILF